MKLLTKSFIATGVLACSALTPVAAAPVLPIVDRWDVDLSGIWSIFAPGSVIRSGDMKTLSWGAPGGAKSSLTINDPPANDTVDTYIGGGAIPPVFNATSISLTHDNNVIAANYSLDTATLQLDLTLTPTIPYAGAGKPVPTVSYSINFNETPNSGRPSNCADPASPTACNDIFVLLTGLLNTSFIYDDREYFVNAFPTSVGKLSTLSDAACAAAEVASGCTGFTTPEDTSTRLDFGFTVSTKPLAVPEPGSVALLGLALGALALASRKRSGQPHA